jgi:hypothetical protein
VYLNCSQTSPATLKEFYAIGDSIKTAAMAQSKLENKLFIEVRGNPNSAKKLATPY